MLGARTKQVYAYGRRGHRIVNVTEDRGDIKTTITSHRASENETISSSSPSPQPIPRHRKKPIISSPIPSPQFKRKNAPTPAAKKKKKASPKAANIRAAKISKSVRHPLGLFPANVPGSPAIAPNLRKKRKALISRGTPFMPNSPFIDVDIVVLDAQGRRLSQERRVSRSDVQINKLPALPLKAVKIKGTALPNVDIHDISNAEEIVSIPKPPKRARAIVISSDESGSDDDEVTVAKLHSFATAQRIQERAIRHTAPTAAGRARAKVISSPSSSSSPPETLMRIPERRPLNRTVFAVAPKVTAAALPAPAPDFIHWTPSQGQPVFSIPVLPSPHAKLRQLTPIRYRPGRANIFPAPPSPPSPTTPTDFDLSLDFSELDLSPAALSAGVGSDVHTSAPPEYLQPLLAECSQTMPHEFSAFIEMFPFDPIVQTPLAAKAHFQKIGEASYSEVFGIGDVVLKVIPLRDEVGHATKATMDDDVESPAPSDSKDVLKEVIVTRAMGEICTGFVKLLRTYVVRGKYPSLLLSLWDQYHEKKGSESVRPDSFTVSQVYAIIVLPNGGPDLEAFSFETASKTGWRQACSLFWQVARALAEAEDLVHFEHRDLHWGQILVKTLPAAIRPARRAASKKLSMDHEGHGIQATVIDLGLARMNSSGDASDVQWTPFDEEIFEGEGDYQFDVYRMMRAHNGNSWEDYRPLTNVMWLHYLAGKLLRSKKLRAPSVSRKSTLAPASAMFTEQECYECLVDVEEMLGRCFASSKPPPAGRRGRRKTPAPVKVAMSDTAGPRSAAEVVQFGRGRGWVR
ncbi:hypothetical protein BKA93DRAFT_885484 [Sparassis latifolia]